MLEYTMTKPLFNLDCIGKEINAVQSEYDRMRMVIYRKINFRIQR